jgi:hypothetical protein
MRLMWIAVDGEGTFSIHPFDPGDKTSRHHLRVFRLKSAGLPHSLRLRFSASGFVFPRWDASPQLPIVRRKIALQMPNLY